MKLIITLLFTIALTPALGGHHFTTLETKSVLGKWCELEYSRKYRCANQLEFQEKYFKQNGKTHEYWRIQRFRRGFLSRGAIEKIIFDTSKHETTEVRLNRENDGAIFVYRCHEGVRICLSYIFVRPTIIGDERRLGFLMGKYQYWYDRRNEQ